MAEKVEILEIDTGNSEQTLRELKDQIKELRKELDGCSIGSDKFKSTLNELSAAQDKLKNATKKSNEALEGSYDALVAKMAELKKAWRATADEAERADLGQQIADINSQLKDMDASIGNYQRNVGNYASAFDDVTLKIENGVAKFDRFNGVARSIIGSFDLVEGGLKAIGVESEEVNTLMEGMQGAMMLTNGLTSVKEGVVAFNNMRTAVQSATGAQTVLNAVMAANPIGAVVAGIAALAAAITIVITKINKTKDALKALNEYSNLVEADWEDMLRSQESELKILEIQGATEDELLEKRKANNLESQRFWKKRVDELQADYDRAHGKLKKKLKEELDDAKEHYKEMLSEEAQFEYDKKIIDAQAEQDRLDKWKEYQKRRSDFEREQEIQRWKEKEALEIAAIEASRERRKQELENVKNDYKELLETLRTAHMSQQELEIEAAENQYLQMQETLQNVLDAGEISMDVFVEKLAEIEVLFVEKIDAINAKFEEGTEKSAEKIVKATKKVTWATMEMGDKINAVAGLTGTAFGQTAQMLNTLAQQQDKTSEEGFEAAKKMSIGAAVMSMLQGIISSWTSAMSLPAPISFITGGLMSAFTATLGGIQIDQIKKQTFQNADKGGSAKTPTPSINTAALMSSPINYTTEVKGAQAEEVIPQRVYVVESDITTTQNKVKTVEEESTF